MSFVYKDKVGKLLVVTKQINFFLPFFPYLKDNVPDRLIDCQHVLPGSPGKLSLLWKPIIVIIKISRNSASRL